MRNRIQQNVRNGAKGQRWRTPALTILVALALTTGLAPDARAEAPASRWQAAIDARWGPGLPTDRKLEIFDAFWTTIDERFAAFQGIDIDGQRCATSTGPRSPPASAAAASPRS